MTRYLPKCPSEIDEAWAAGLFEGEGYISVRHGYEKDGKPPTIHCGINLCDQDVLERFNITVGVGCICATVYYEEGRRPRYTWTTSGRGAQQLLQGFYSWLGERRRERADLALRLLAEQFAPRPCVVCGKYFERNRKALYCSKRCCNTASRRRHGVLPRNK